MGKNHLKRHEAPNTWPIKRKNITFITRPKPGSHKLELSIPLSLVIKDMLGFASTTKEVRKILHDEEVLVNGKKRHNFRYPLGLLDVLTFPKLKESYVLLIDKKNKLYVEKIDSKLALTKISKIVDKKVAKKGEINLVTFDGRQLPVKKDTFKTGDSVLITVPGQEIKETLKLEKGASILLFKGKYAGTVTLVEELKGNEIYFKVDKDVVHTSKKYAIVIGTSKPIYNIK